MSLGWIRPASMILELLLLVLAWPRPFCLQLSLVLQLFYLPTFMSLVVLSFKQLLGPELQQGFELEQGQLMLMLELEPR